MTDGQSRRDVLVGGAALAAALAVATATRDADAQTADVGALNMLLTTEYQLVGAYTLILGLLSSPSGSDPDMSIAPTAAAISTQFKTQHQNHATQLAALIASLQGTPVDPSTAEIYSPPTTSTGFSLTVIKVIKLAANLERTAAIAYTTALRTLSAATNAQVVASIGGVETQHFIVLYLLANKLVAQGMAAASMAANVVPQSFVTSVGTGTTGLDTVADFTFA